MYTSTPGAIAHQLPFWMNTDDPGTRARQITTLLYGVVYAALLWHLWRGPAEPARMIAAWYLTFFLLLVIAAPFVFPWYFLWFAVLGPLLPGHGYLLLTGIATYTVSLVDPLWAFVEYVPWVQDGFGRMVGAPVVVQFVPAGLCLLVLLVRHRSLLLAGAPRIPASPLSARHGWPGSAVPRRIPAPRISHEVER